jgi:hypothetical protein
MFTWFATGGLALALLTQGSGAPAASVATILQQVDAAAATIASEDPARAQDGFATLLDAILSLTARLDNGTGVARSVASAREQVRGHADPAAIRVSLGAAYKTLTSGSAFDMPVVDEVTDITRLMKGRFDSARQAIRSNRTKDGVRDLLEVGLMMTTPIQQ